MILVRDEFQCIPITAIIWHFVRAGLVPAPEGDHKGTPVQHQV
jgi:hypothetical protein